MNSLLRNASFWEKSKEPRKKRRDRKKEKITLLIMATYVCHAVWTAHALRSTNSKLNAAGLLKFVLTSVFQGFKPEHQGMLLVLRHRVCPMLWVIF